MKIRIRYDDQITTVDVPEEEFTLMIEVDYEQRLEKAKDPSSVQRRSPQDIIDELNKADYNNCHKHNRRWDGEAVPASIYGMAGKSTFLRMWMIPAKSTISTWMNFRIWLPWPGSGMRSVTKSCGPGFGKS